MPFVFMPFEPNVMAAEALKRLPAAVAIASSVDEIPGSVEETAIVSLDPGNHCANVANPSLIVTGYLTCPGWRLHTTDVYEVVQTAGFDLSSMVKFDVILDPSKKFVAYLNGLPSESVAYDILLHMP